MRLIFLFLAIATASAHAADPKHESCESLLVDNLIDVQLDSRDEILETAQRTIAMLFADFLNSDRTQQNLLASKLSVGSVLDLMYSQSAALYEYHNMSITPKARRLMKLGLDPYSKTFYDLPIGPYYYDYLHSPLQKYFSTVMVAYAALNSELDPQAKLEIVDLGAGTGDTTESLRMLFPSSNIVALDRSTSMLRKLSQRFPGVETVVSDFGDAPLPFEPASKDFATAICSAGQYLNPGQFVYFLRHVKRILKPGGYFLMEFGIKGHTTSGPKYADIKKFQAWVRDRGFEVESKISLHMKIGDFLYYPIVARKPLL